MASLEEYAAASARLLFERLAPRNPLAAGQIVDILPENNDTPTVAIAAGGATRRAAYLPPIAPVVGGTIFWERADARLDAPPQVIAPNFQVASDDSAYGVGAYGTGVYGR